MSGMGARSSSGKGIIRPLSLGFLGSRFISNVSSARSGYEGLKEDLQTFYDTLLKDNLASVENDRKWAEEQAQKQMDFQRDMSNTAYQRGVADLKAAGLNPALAYANAGASSPTGSLASSATSETGLAINRENNVYSLLNNVISNVLGFIPSMFNSITRRLPSVATKVTYRTK